MTAEIALLNKHGVALAADSAVTITRVRGQKVYNASNKLFALSKREPVGIMVYGNAEYMGVPWETIIKIYRQQLCDRSFATLAEYFEDFLAFLGRDDDLFGAEAQAINAEEDATSVFFTVRNAIEEKVKAYIETNGEIGDEETAIITAEVIRDRCAAVGDKPYPAGFGPEQDEEVRARYADVVTEAMQIVFRQLPLTDEDEAALRDIAVYSLTRAFFSSQAGGSMSGVVIAGFGRREHFPRLRAATVEARVAGRLKYEVNERRYAEISAHTGSAIVPFAQTDAFTLFVEGMDPTYAAAAYGFVFEALREFPQRIITSLDLDPAVRDEVLGQWYGVSDALFQEFYQRAREQQHKQYVTPLLEVIEVLPKDELAAVAEALVNLTSLRRKVSMDAETVGGPIDVAIISKGDGLVWLRRKQYFPPELNPHFLSNYFRSNNADAHD